MAATVAAAAEAKGRQHTGKAVGLAAHDASGHLAPLTITRRYYVLVSRDLSCRSTRDDVLLERSRSHAVPIEGPGSDQKCQRTPGLGLATVLVDRACLRDVHAGGLQGLRRPGCGIPCRL